MSDQMDRRKARSPCMWFSLSFPEAIYEKSKDSTHIRGCSIVRTRHRDRTQGAHDTCEASSLRLSDTLAPNKPLSYASVAHLYSDPQFKGVMLLH